MQQPTQRQVADGLRSEVAEHRALELGADPLFANRWSPRAMTGATLAEDEYLPLFEAARWAPSSFNNQHWRFVYATREDEEFETFLDLLNDANRSWASEAGVLVAIFSKRTYDHDGEPVGSNSFDTGAAWQNLALEGARRGLAVHAMGGFDQDRAHDALAVPEAEFDVEVMVAIGERADPETLPEGLREREQPSGRKDLADIVDRGSFE